MRSIHIRRAAILLCGILAACDSPSGGGGAKETPGIHIVSGAGVSDTVDAMLPAPLVVRVIGANGRPLANAEVGFLSTAIAEGSDQPTVVVNPTQGEGGGVYAIEHTDAEGRAAVRVRMFRKAMPGGVVVVVPAVDTFAIAPYTILPGAPRRVSSLPADTALLVGASFTLRAVAVDRYENPREATGATVRVASGPVTLGGNTVAGTAVGRAAVVTELAGSVDTSYVSVVPDATIAAYTAVAITNQVATLYTLRLDGSQVQARVTTGTFQGYNASMGSAWSADGSKLFYHDSNTDHTRSLYVLDVATGARQRLLPTADRMLEEAWPRFANGWVYFEGGTFDDWSKGTVNEPLAYRVRPDGTEKTLVVPWEGIGTSRHGAPSPDGTRVAFTGSYGNLALQVLDVASGVAHGLGVIGQSPRWRTDGSEILYVASGDLTYGSGAIRAIRPDGTGDRAITTSAARYAAHFDLSPDGAYVIAATDQGVLTLIQLSTGIEMPIAVPSITQRLLAPSWRP